MSEIVCHSGCYLIHTVPWPHYPNKNIFSDRRNRLYGKSASLQSWDVAVNCSIAQDRQLQKLCHQRCCGSGYRRMSSSLWSVVVAHGRRRQDDSHQLSMTQNFLVVHAVVLYSSAWRTIVLVTVHDCNALALCMRVCCVQITRWDPMRQYCTPVVIHRSTAFCYQKAIRQIHISCVSLLRVSTLILPKIQSSLPSGWVCCSASCSDNVDVNVCLLSDV